MSIVLTLAGEVDVPRSLTFADLAAIPAEHQIVDVSRLVPGRKGDAVKLAGLLALVQPKGTAKWLGLHAARDDFHASIPLDAVADKALVIYRLDSQPLPDKAG